MKINSIIIRDVSRYVTEYLSLHLKKEYCYHSYTHTVEVVGAAEKIAAELNLSKDETRVLITAAWFHDTGYTEGMENHEATGSSIAENFLKEKGVDDTDIEKVKASIMTTLYPQKPHTLIEEILCDADLAHLGNKIFFEKSDLLRREWMAAKNTYYTDLEWYQLNYDFITGHQFHTDYCKEEFGIRKSKNEKELKRRISALEVNGILSICPLITTLKNNLQ
jgi:predicted metal-dependent HD superfamily phosphohydrolase